MAIQFAKKRGVGLLAFLALSTSLGSSAAFAQANPLGQIYTDQIPPFANYYYSTDSTKCNGAPQCWLPAQQATASGGGGSASNASVGPAGSANGNSTSVQGNDGAPLARDATLTNGNLKAQISNFPATQAISAANLPLPAGAAQDATLTNGNLVAKISTLPALPAGNNNIGSVNVGNFPSSQTINGSVSVNNLPASQTVNGSVSVNNFPATQPISAASLPLPAGAAQDSTLTGGTAKFQVTSIPAITGTVTASPGDGSITTLPAGTGVGTYGPVVDTQGYASVAYSFSTIPAGASIGFQESGNYNSSTGAGDWGLVTPLSDSAGALVSGTGTVPGTYVVARGARWQRLVILTYSSGTIAGTYQPKGSPRPAPGVIQDLATEAALGSSTDTASPTGVTLLALNKSQAQSLNSLLSNGTLINTPASVAWTGGNYTVTASAATAIPALSTRKQLNYQVQGSGTACGSWETTSPTITLLSSGQTVCGGAGAFRLIDGSTSNSQPGAGLPNQPLTVIGLAPSSGTLTLNIAFEYR